MVSSWFKPRVCHITKLWACINRVDTFMCPYALPIIQIPYPFSSLCLSCNLSSSLRSLQIHTFSYSFCPLYCFHFLYIWKKIKKSLKLLSLIPVSILLFVDDDLFISQEKSYKKSNTNISYSYNIISSLFKQFNLVIEHNKLEVFHFLRSIKNNNTPSLDLRSLGNPLLQSKDIW